MIHPKIRSYSELILLDTFEKRFDYLKLGGKVGEETFGFERYFNQQFYRSTEWKRIRDYVIMRDNGMDLGVDGYEIHGKIIIHHMNPINIDDIRQASDYLMNPEFLICVTHNTHNAIHYGSSDLLIRAPVERTKNDTCPWKLNGGERRHGEEHTRNHQENDRTYGGVRPLRPGAYRSY